MGEQKKLLARKKEDKKNRKAVQKASKYRVKKGKRGNMDEMSAPKSMQTATGNKYSIK
jgi:hypothetical protein